MQLRSRVAQEEFSLADGMTIGRLASCTIQLQDSSISRHHACIEEVGGILFLVDQGSSNGCFRNGMRVPRCELRVGDLITLGALAFDVVGEPATQVEPPPKPRSAPSPATQSTAASASSRAAEAAAQRARLHREIAGDRRSRGLGDLGQQSFGVQVLIGVCALALMYGVIVGVRYLAAAI